MLGISVSSVRLILVEDLKDNIYRNNLPTTSASKAAITAKIQAIVLEECECVINSFACRVSDWFRLKGGYVLSIV